MMTLFANGCLFAVMMFMAAFIVLFVIEHLK